MASSLFSGIILMDSNITIKVVNSYLSLYNVPTYPKLWSTLIKMEENGAQNGQVVSDNQETESEVIETMETLLAQEGLGLDLPKAGDIRTGSIASVSNSEILVSVGAKSEGVITGRELDHMSKEERAALEVGSEISVFIVNTEDRNGNLVLSYGRAREVKDWEDAEKLLDSKEAYEGEIIGYNKGGLIVPLGRLRGFVPASLVSMLRRAASTGETPEQRWGEMVGEAITVKIIEVDRTRRKLIMSEKAALSETRETLKDRLLDELSIGDERDGRVTSLADFGAFVNIDGADGLVHLSEVSWDRIQHPNEVLKVGQDVKVQVIAIDTENKRIGLSLRRLQEDPWIQKVGHLREGQLIEGTVTHLTKFGAFAKLDDELEGLIHISELDDKRIAHPKEVISEDDTLTLRIIKIDTDRRRIGLSLRKVDSAAYTDLDWKMMRDELEAMDSDDEEVIAAEEAQAEAAAAEAEALEAETEVETEAEVEAEEVEAEVEAETEAEEEAEEETEAEVEAEEEVETEVEVEKEADAEVEAEEETEVEAEVEAEVEVEAEAEEEAETEVEAEDEPEAEMEVEAEVETEAEVKAEAETEVEETLEDEPAAAEETPEEDVQPEETAAEEEPEPEPEPEEEEAAE